MPAPAPPADPPEDRPESKRRVAEHGEVFTRPREVNAMLDLVAAECERVDSRFLEPACGTGNFLCEVFRRKLAAVDARRRRSRPAWERDAVLAASSLYGIDLLPDNVAACRDRLCGVFDGAYAARFGGPASDRCRAAVRHVLSLNVVCGDALTMRTVGAGGADAGPIVFPEWSPVNGTQVKRRDFRFDHVVDDAGQRDMPLFSDMNEAAYLPEPVADYPLVHFLDLAGPAPSEPGAA